MIFDISALSGRFTVRRLKDADVPAMLALAKTNEVYYRYHAPAASSEVFWFYQSRRSVHQRLFRLSADGAVNSSKGEYHASYLPKGCGI